MGMGKLNKPNEWEFIRQNWLFDDFFAYTSGGIWTSLASTGTVTIGSGPATTVNLASGTSAGNEAAVWSTNKFFQFQANKPLDSCFRINAQEANTNNLSMFVGFSSLVTTGLVTNANPNAISSNFTGCGFFLPAGSTNWSVVSSVGTTQLITPTIEAAGATADQYLQVQVDIVGTNIEATFMVGNADNTGGFSGPATQGGVFPTGLQQAREGLSGFNKAIKHRLAYSGAAQMSGGVYLRSASNTSETVKVDLIGLLGLR
jgi:hypothetical protein